jgi:hypothetical protein
MSSLTVLNAHDCRTCQVRETLKPGLQSLEGEMKRNFVFQMLISELVVHFNHLPQTLPVVSLSYSPTLICRSFR